MEAQKIDNQDISFHDLSMLDSRGRLFFYNQKLYRGITSEISSLYKDLFDNKVIQDLIEKKILVETKISNLQLDGYECVLEHRSIPFVTYPHEWCDLMFKDATLLHLDFLIELSYNNLTSEDVFSLNILFDGHQALFVDFCSIVPAHEIPRWPGRAEDQFRSHFLIPLIIMDRNYPRVARALMKDSYYVSSQQLKFEIEAFNPRETAKSKMSRWKSTLLLLAREKTPLFFRDFAKRLFFASKKAASKQNKVSYSNLLLEMKEKVSNFILSPIEIQKDQYYDSFSASLQPSSEWTIKQENIYRILQEYQPQSCLDIDSDYGWYAQLAASCGSQVVAFDAEEACVRKIYLDAKKNNLYVVPLVIDFASQSFNLSNDYFSSIYKRLDCDLVLALNLFFHIFFKRHITLEKALNRICNLSKKWVLLEYLSKEELKTYIPNRDQRSDLYWSTNHWHSLEEIVSMLQNKYQMEVTVLSSYPDQRKLLFCQKILLETT